MFQPFHTSPLQKLDMYTTNQEIEKIVEASIGTYPTAREAYFMRESLRNLVRLANAELLFEMRRSVALATGTAKTAQRKRRSRTKRTSRSLQLRLDLNNK
jgi:hypothetical protein